MSTILSAEFRSKSVNTRTVVLSFHRFQLIECFSSLSKINHNMQMTIDWVIERQKCRRRRRHCQATSSIQPAIQNKYISNQFFVLLFPRLLFAPFRRSSDRTASQKSKRQLARRFPKTCDPGHKYFMMKWRNDI